VRVLVVDDVRTNRLLINKYLERLGHDALNANDGREAVDVVAREQPDLVLMDVMMPQMDGFEAAAEIRASLGDDNWIPIIFLSAMVGDEDIARGIEAGGDDYLLKPVSPTVLESKLRAMERLSAMRRKISDYACRLNELHETQLLEIEEARTVFDKMTRVAEIPAEWVSVATRPSSRFSGDVVAAAFTGKGELNLLFGDASGHGLAAGLTVLPATDLFYSLSKRNVPFAEMIGKLNKRMCDVLPVGHFVAAILARVSLRERCVQLWNGGCLPVWALDESGELVWSAPSIGLPLGVSPQEQVDGIVDFSFAAKTPERLYLHSDGLSDALDETGNPFRVERLLTELSSTAPDNRLCAVMGALDGHLAGLRAQDDVTLIEVSLPTAPTH
jgi:CheY-like chemotaxis protein